MRFMTKIIDIDLKSESGEHLLVNGLNGLVDIVHRKEYVLIREAMKRNSVQFLEQEKGLFEKMIKRGYIVPDDYKEEIIRDEIIRKLKIEQCRQNNKFKNVVFVLTYDCNFNCPYCYEKDVISKRKMSFEQVDQIFKIGNGEIEMISFFGGEPLLPENRKLIEYIISKAPDVSYGMITNGYYLEEFFEIFKNLKWHNIQVTLDGEKEIHNKTRIQKNGKGSFEKIMNGIKLYAENRIVVRIRMNVNHNNITSCLRLKNSLEKEVWSEYLQFEIQEVFQVGQEEKRYLSELLLEDDVKSIKKNEILKSMGVLSNFLFMRKQMRPIIRACDTECIKRFFDPDGNVYSCILAVGNVQKRIGTYNTEIHYEQNSMYQRDITTIPVCQTCKYALFCGGGCSNGVFEQLDTMFVPNCTAIKREMEEIIPYLYKLNFGKK